MKQMLEFDETQQPAETTLAQLKVALNNFIATTGVNSLQLHEVRRSKSRTLAEAFLTWGDGELTAAQMQTVTAILQSQPGLVGYTPPMLEQLNVVHLTGLTTTATLAAGKILFGYGVAPQYSFATDRLGMRDVSGFTSDGPEANPQIFSYFSVLAWVSAGTGSALTIPVNGITITADGKDPLQLKNKSQIVVEEASGPYGFSDGYKMFWVDVAGNLFLANSNDTPGWIPYADAVANGAV